MIEASYSGSGSDFLPSVDTSQFLTVRPAPATQLMIQTQPSSASTAGQTFATQPVIYEEDQYGNIETGDNTTVVTVALGSGTGPLQGTVTATVVGGVATFTNLRDNTAENITLKFSSGNLAAAVSNSIGVSPAAAAKVVFGQQPTNATAGAPISPAVTVKVEDVYDNLVTTDASTVTLTLGSGTFEGGSSTATATASGGVATFGGLKIDAAGSYTLSATDGSLTASGASNTFTIGAASASQLVLGQQPTNTTAGAAVSPAVTVKVEDAYDNLVTTDTSTVTLTLSTGTFDGGSKISTTAASGASPLSAA